VNGRAFRFGRERLFASSPISHGHRDLGFGPPKNITLVFLPSRAPELNPVENIWQYLRQNWLRWVLREIRAQDQSGLAAENLNRRTPAGKMIRDVGGILRKGLREPEQDKAPPGTGQRPDQEHKIIDRFEQHAVILGESG
jgi:hypothetical protein